MNNAPRQDHNRNPFVGRRQAFRQWLFLVSWRLIFRVVGSLSPGLAGKLALRSFTTPPKFPLNPMERRLYEQSEFTLQNIQGRRIAIRSWGTGPVVLFSHGWGGQGVHFHALIEALVRNGYRAVAFDAPAHGNSPGKRTHMLEVSRILAAVGKNLGPIDTLVGHSFGCGTALLAQSHYGLKAGKLVLFACFDDIHWITRRFAEVFELSEQVLHAMMKAAHRKYSHQDRDAWDWPELSPMNTIQTVACDILLVHDTQDREVPHAHALRLIEQHTRAELLTTRGLGHKRLLGDPETVQYCTEFISRAS
ncbi:MAG: alpha/beta hydrolase [Candidatus Thiodiazotropha sp.]